MHVGSIISKFVFTLIYLFNNLQCSFTGAVVGSSCHTSTVAVELGEVLVSKTIPPDNQVRTYEVSTLGGSF